MKEMRSEMDSKLAMEMERFKEESQPTLKRKA